MRNNKKKWEVLLITILTILCIGANVYAHSGRTDSRGGHRDNKNKSGLGSYHYHCGGYPAHLHKNGVCLYSTTKTKSNKSSIKSNTKSKTTKKKDNTVKASSIQIKENIYEMEMGDLEYITANILPSNTTNKEIKWTSSDKNIATIDENGFITAKKPGKVKITASTSNGKTDTIKINIKEKINNIVDYKTNDINNSIKSSTKESEASLNQIGGILGISLLGGGSYLGYKVYKSKKNNS